MKYVVKQKIIALKPEYTVSDLTGKQIYKINGSFLGRESFSICDLEGKELAKCATDMSPLNFLASILRYNLKKYHIKLNDESQISVARTINIFSAKLKVESKLGELQFGYSVKGSYQFTLNGNVACDIEKKNLVIGGDEYHVEIDDAQSQEAFLLTAIALDRIYFTAR